MKQDHILVIDRPGNKFKVYVVAKNGEKVHLGESVNSVANVIKHIKVAHKIWNGLEKSADIEDIIAQITIVYNGKSNALKKKLIRIVTINPEEEDAA
jgi:hypothetical protein